jgi:hypothetical protein
MGHVALAAGRLAYRPVRTATGPDRWSGPLGTPGQAVSLAMMSLKVFDGRMTALVFSGSGR